MTEPNTLLAARQAAGMSRADVFRALGISRRTLEDWESEKRHAPNYTVIFLLAFYRNPEAMLSLLQEVKN